MILQPSNNKTHSNDDAEADVLILGGGTAALLAAIAIKRHLPDRKLLMVRSTKLGIIGVGEGTIATIGRFLHHYLGIEPLRFHQEVRPSIKLGIQFLWGSDTPYHYSFAPQFSAGNPAQSRFSQPIGAFCSSDATYANEASSLMYHGKVACLNSEGAPVLSPRFAYHLENRRFVEFLERYTDELGVRKLDAIVQHVSVNKDGVETLRLDSGEHVSAKLFIDCSGFRSELLGKALNEDFLSFDNSLFCDRAVVGGWARDTDTYHAFTLAEAMNSGWSWRIEHDEIVNRGYVYSSSFITDEEAESEFRMKNPKVDSTRIVNFRSGVYRRTWVKNVVAIGNAAGFVEPLEATAIGFMTSAIDQVVAILRSSHVAEIHRSIFNRGQQENWMQVRDFLALHYKPNRHSRSAFWDACRNDAELGDAQEIFDFYKESGPNFQPLRKRLSSDIFGPEGYLSVLVGQKVSHRSRCCTKNENDGWLRYKRQLRGSADSALSMQDYLMLIREGVAVPPLG